MNLQQFLDKNYDENYGNNYTFLISEYFQSEIISYISSQDYWENMILIWWSALRLLYGSHRLTRDLDYDTVWIDYDYFTYICKDIESHLNKKWYQTNIQTSKANNWHCNFRIKIELTTVEYWKITIPTDIPLRIKMDVANRNWNYSTEYRKLLNDFSDVYVKTATLNVLLSKKIISLIERNHYTSLHKDVYDIASVMPKTSPDIDYLLYELDLYNTNQVQEVLMHKLNAVVLDNLDELAFDLSYILYSDEHLENIYNIKNILIDWLN